MVEIEPIIEGNGLEEQGSNVTAGSIIPENFSDFTPISLGNLNPIKKESEFYDKYVNVKHPLFLSLGRNDICPCGSGKKLKYCHIEAHAQAISQWKTPESKGVSKRRMEKHLKKLDKLKKREEIRKANEKRRK